MITISYNLNGNVDTPRSITVKKTHVNVERLILPGDKNVGIQWDIEGEIRDIEKIQPNCGCTRDIVTIDDKIIASFTEDIIGKDGNIIKDLTKITKEIRNIGYLAVTRDLTVYMEDGEPLTIPSGASVIYNPNKAKVVLSFTINVDISKLPYPADNELISDAILAE
jgi:hypothetical protein